VSGKGGKIKRNSWEREDRDRRNKEAGGRIGSALPSRGGRLEKVRCGINTDAARSLPPALPARTNNGHKSIRGEKRGRDPAGELEAIQWTPGARQNLAQDNSSCLSETC